MKITIDAKNLDGPKPVISVRVEDDEPKLEIDGGGIEPGQNEEKRFIYWWKFRDHSDGLTTATLELDTGDVEKLKEILAPFCFDK